MIFTSQQGSACAKSFNPDLNFSQSEKFSGSTTTCRIGIALADNGGENDEQSGVVDKVADW